MVFINILVWISLLVWPPSRDLTMPHNDCAQDCTLGCCRKYRQFDFGESTSLTNTLQHNLHAICHHRWVYVCKFCSGQIVLMATLMVFVSMVTVLVLLMVMTEPKVLRCVDWLSPGQYESLEWLRAFYQPKLSQTHSFPLANASYRKLYSSHNTALWSWHSSRLSWWLTISSRL